MRNKWMKTNMVLFLLLIGAVAQSSVVKADEAPAVDLDPKNICVIPKLDGDKVPFPLKGANTKYELAENETYILNGTLVQEEGKIFFRVDFKTQPWLATQKRMQFPMFLVDHNDVSMMKKYGGNLVQMAVVVRKKDVSTSPYGLGG